MSLSNEILQGNIHNVKRYLQQGVEIQEIDEYGYTPLIEAAIANNIDISKLLLEQGADVNGRDLTGATALHWTVDNSNHELSQLLLKYGADPNAYTNYSEPIILKPYLRQQRQLKNLLMKYGADLSFAQDYLYTKLLGHRFELRGKVDIIDPKGTFVEINLEGFILEFSVNVIRRSLMDFKKNFAARHLRHKFGELQIIIDALHNASDLLHYQPYYISIDRHEKRIRKLLNHQLLVLAMGYSGHAISFVRYGNIWAKCDRSVDSRNPSSVVFYHIRRPEALNYEFYKELLYERHNDNYIHDYLPNKLGLEPITQLPIGLQITGNCAWANIEATIPTILFILLMRDMRLNANELIAQKEELLSLYNEWLEWDKNRALHHMLDRFKHADRARRTSIAATLTAIVFQCCHMGKKSDIKRADKIIPLLLQDEYRFILDTYIEIYTKQNRTPEGKNFKKIIEFCEV